MSECKLRKSRVTLLDGREVTMRALPMNREVVAQVKEFNEGSLEAYLGLVERSLIVDQPREEVDAVLDGQGLPYPGALDGKELQVLEAVLLAMFP